MSTTLPVEPMVRACYEAARQHTERLAFALGGGRATQEQVDAAQADEGRLAAAMAALQGRLSLPSSSPERIVHVPSRSTPNRTYRVIVSPDGGDSCQFENDEGGYEVCPGFKFRRTCRHIERARALVDDPCRTLARDITDAWYGTDERGRDAWWRDLTLTEQALSYSLSEIEGTGRSSDPVGPELARFIRTAEQAAVRVRARASAIYRAAEASLARDSERAAAG